MDGKDRKALHAVPRVLDLDQALKIDENYEKKLSAVEDQIVLEYLKQARINLNIRQVN
jgi:hypothetical protein